MDTSFKDTVIIIPAYNEQERIVFVIDEVRTELPEVSIVVVNDNSKDETAKKAKEKDVTVISHPYNMGYSAALLTGLKFAYYKGFNNAVLFDGDGQHIASEIKTLFNEQKSSQSDIVIGSRFIVKSDYNHGFLKTIGTNLFSSLIKAFTKKRITDPTSGFQLLNKKVIKAYTQMSGFPEFPDANLIIYVLKKGLTVSETPVKMRLREDGESMHSGIWNPIKYMILMLYSLLLAAVFTRREKQ